MGIHIINPLLGIVPSTLNPLYISCCYFCPEAQVDNLILKLLLALARSLAPSLFLWESEGALPATLPFLNYKGFIRAFRHW